MRRASLQAIRFGNALLAVIGLAACGQDDLSWGEAITLTPVPASEQLAVDSAGKPRLVADTTEFGAPGEVGICQETIRVARQNDGTLVAAWWSVRPDSSAALRAALSSDGGRSWRPSLVVDSLDASVTGCRRPSASISASVGFVHLAYGMKAREGAGVFYAHSMTQGRSWEAPVAIVYGDRVTAASVAADHGLVAVAYEEPSGAEPRIGLALSRDWGHIFGVRMRGSSGVGAATQPLVAVAGRQVAISWLQRADGEKTAGASRIVRVGRLP